MSEVAKQINGRDTMTPLGLKELFVINLCASMTPMPDVPKQLKGFEKHKLYQISRVEDGRRRYRLRMGFFSTEVDAELIVPSLRSMYPAALVSCALSEDLRHVAAGPIPVEKSAPPEASVPQHAPPTTAASAPTRSQPVVAPVHAPPQIHSQAHPQTHAKTSAQASHAHIPTRTTTAVGSPTKPATNAPIQATAQATVPATAQSTGKLELADSPPIKPTATAADETQRFYVGRGIDIPDCPLELSTDDLKPAAVTPIAAKAVQSASAPQATKTTTAVPPARPAQTPAPAAASASIPKPIGTASRPATVTTSPPTVKPQPIVAATIQVPTNLGQGDDYIPILDTTLTIRTLTKAEADDPNRAKYFVVQLASSDGPIDISTMPKLDIFAAYQLYSVALMEGGGICHTLRLGFFKERVSAEAVMGYLKTFFATPSVTQVSSAEYERFGGDVGKQSPSANMQDGQRASAPAKLAASAPVTNAKPAAMPPVKAAKPTVAPPSAVRASAAKQPSFLSRLIGKQLD
jgi:hypothetical protein